MAQVEETLYLDFDDVLIKPRISGVESRKDATLARPLKDDWAPVPLMSANMDTVTGPDMALALARFNWTPVLHKYIDKPELTELFDTLERENIDARNVFLSRGTSENDRAKLIDRLEHEPRIQSVCIDVANGYRESVFAYVEELRNGLCKDKILMVGNMATPDAALRYANIGVDIIKCGIGPGSACITRVQTGVGVPQVSMILSVREALDAGGFSTLLCADGGCKRPGDVAKAFAAGADFVMLGGMLAGHNECPGEVTYASGKKLKRFSGMAAKQSQWKGVPTYGAEEGKTVFVDLKGPVCDTVHEVEGGLRSACTYTNSHDLKELAESTLIRTHVQENRVFA